MIDDLLRLDFTEDGVVHEIKKSKSGQRAAYYQLLYYLYYLKQEKGIETTGMIDYPLLHRREEVKLTQDAEEEIRQIVRDIQSTREMTRPPTVEKPMAICKKCAYQELCWG
jgi:CRISPR-associated exonuclease Cas4